MAGGGSEAATAGRAPDGRRLLDGRLKVRHLRLATAIADRGSIVGAAQYLGITQPVVTRGLQELEAIVGAPLFTRGARGVAPTPVGEVFLTHARSLVAQLLTTATDVDDFASGRAGRVMVGTHLAGTNVLLPQALLTYKAERPGVVVVVREVTPSVSTAALVAGELDLVVGRLAPTSPSPHLIQIPLYREPIRLVVGLEHPQADAAPSLRDLLDYPWILPDEPTALRHELTQVFVDAGLDLPADRVETTSILTMRSLLVGGAYVAALPYLIAAGDPRLRVLGTELPGVGRTVGITRQRQAALSAHGRDFQQHLETAAAGLRLTLDTGSGG